MAVSVLPVSDAKTEFVNALYFLPPDEISDLAGLMLKVVAEKSTEGHNFITRDELLAFREEKTIIKCPNCNSQEFVRFGIRRGNQYYRCKDCSKTFTSLTNTFLDYTKKDFLTWQKFIQCMVDGFKLQKTADRCKISLRTAFVWRHKILDALVRNQETQRFTGKVEVDDTLLPVSLKGSRKLRRAPHQRGTPAKKPGTSKEKVSVVCLIDQDGRIFSKVTALGRPSIEDLRQVFDRKFPNKNRKTKFVTDGDKAYAAFAKENKFDHIRIVGAMGRQGEHRVQRINGYHKRLKEFLAPFHGVSTKHLNNYLAWFNVVNEKKKNGTDLMKLCIRRPIGTRASGLSKRRARPIMQRPRRPRRRV